MLRFGRWLRRCALLLSLPALAHAADAAYTVGQRVECDLRRIGIWEAGEVLDAQHESWGSRYRVRLDGGGGEWNCDPGYMRAAAAAAPSSGTATAAAPTAAPEATTAASASAPASLFAVGSTVLASPNQMDAIWNRCEVLQAPSDGGSYRLECADEYRGGDGRLYPSLNALSVPQRWVRADDPQFRPDIRIADVRAQLAEQAAARDAPPAPPPADGDARAVQAGSYECWSFSSARFGLNFEVIGDGRYRAADGSEHDFSHDPSSGAVEFEGYLRESLPDGYTAVYHEHQGIPTVSFRSARGAEVSFCQRS